MGAGGRIASWSGRWWFRIVVAVLAVLVVYVGVTFAQVVQVAGRDQAQPAGAIVIMGAAQFDGTPSAVFESRLQHGLELYEEGLAERVVVTGGRQAGDRFTEAESGANWLRARGVPDSALRLEVDGSNSYEQLAASANFLAGEEVDEVIVVSDPFHGKRLEEIADELDLEAHVSPTGSSPISGWSEARAMVRETVAVSVGRLIGYRRMMRVDDTVQGV
jgi:uncharacterized SAM-binding protein YcdF (DUF218 family)